MALFSDQWKPDSNTQVSFRNPSVTTLQGNTGGLTLVGGTASGDDLTLSSTSNATKGSIILGTSAYDEVNNRLGIATLTPVTGFDSRGAVNSVTWSDTFNRNTAAYFRADFDQTVPTTLSGIFGVDSVFTPTANSALNINGALYNLSIAGTFANTAGIATKAMQAQIAITGSGAHTIQFIGNESRISTTAASTASLSNANNAAMHGLLNIVGTNNITGASCILATATFPNLTATATNIYGIRIANPTKGANYTVTNFSAVRIEDNTMTVATAKVGVHQVGTNYHNRLNGNTTIGADSTPTNALTVVGTADFSVAIVPDTNDGATIGTTALQWSDLFLAEGAVINWDNGDVTITQTNNVLAIAGTTDTTFDGSVRSSSNAGGVGYTTGAGGTVIQGAGSGKATGVTLNTICGQITMNNAALAAGAEVSFTVTNSACATTDCVVVNHDSVGTLGAYGVYANNIGAGSFAITVTNLSIGSLSEAIVLNFAIIKAVTS